MNIEDLLPEEMTLEEKFEYLRENLLPRNPLYSDEDVTIEIPQELVDVYFKYINGEVLTSELKRFNITSTVN